MAQVSWWLVVMLAFSGVAMALLSCLIGMRPKLENPLWWGLYAVWIAIALVTRIEAPFRTLWVSSILAGLLHGATAALLLDRYLVNNPWHAQQMQTPKNKLALQFIVTGLVVGAVFGLIVAAIAWSIRRLG